VKYKTFLKIFVIFIILLYNNILICKIMGIEDKMNKKGRREEKKERKKERKKKEQRKLEIFIKVLF